MGQICKIVEISQAHNIDLGHVGKKAFELAELKRLGVLIPEGFIVKTTFFEDFLEKTGISKDIEKVKKTFSPSLGDSADELFQPIREKIMRTHIPPNLASELHGFYRKLVGELKQASVDIYSSSKTGESMVFSDIFGDTNMVLKIKKIWAGHLDTPAAVVVIRNLKSEIKGKTSTADPSADKRLTAKQTDKLIEYCKIIQNRFYFPKEIEYAVEKGKIYITKINPFTNAVVGLSEKALNLNRARKIIAKGISLYPGIATGPAKILNDPSIDMLIKKDNILIIPDLKASLYNRLKRAKAIIVDSSLINPRDKALYRRNIQIPTVEGTKNAAKIIKNGNVITVNGISGEIYSGGLIS